MTLRAAFLVGLALLVLAPGALAQAPTGITYGASDTLPSSNCPTCAGVEAHAGIAPAPPCNDCTTLGASAGAETEDTHGSAHATLCRGGFVYVCVIDRQVTF
jgi:hypothetical protein